MKRLFQCNEGLKMIVNRYFLVCMFSTLCVSTRSVSDRVTGLQQTSYDGCQKSFHHHGDVIMSPLYPSPYADNLTCEYSIHVPSSGSILLLFSKISLEPSPVCAYDSLKIFDGSNTSSSLLRNLCGNESLPDPVYSSGNQLLLVFSSDSCISSDGFQVFVHVIDTNQNLKNECPTSPIESNGHAVTSPMFPSNYENEQSCEYYIQAPSTSVILLLFSNFSLESSTDCVRDYLKIYDDSSPSRSLLATLCGNTSLPLPILSSGSSLKLTFNSDRIITSSGFRAFCHFIESTTSRIQSSQSFFLIGASLGLGIVIICILGIIGYKMKRTAHSISRKTLPATPSVTGSDPHPHYLSPNESDLKEFSRSKLKLLECIGSGEFGSVHRGKALGILQPNVEETVAVKRIKDNASITEKRGFCLELEIYKALEFHPNVVAMFGFCTTSDPLCIILEYLSNGNLHKYLKNLLQSQGLEDTLANSMNLMMYALQIAKGMEYLASKNYVHGDLMARNILLSSKFVCKISNFGRTRELTDEEELEVDIVELHSIRWTAPEKILDSICTKACDVWSFGVVLWELLTLGSYPYGGKSTKEMVASIDKGYLLPKPEFCDDEHYEMMTKCLQRNPVNRPNFSQLRSQLDEIMDKCKNYFQMEGSSEMAYSRRIYDAHSGFTYQSPKEENDSAHYYSIELTPMSSK